MLGREVEVRVVHALGLDDGEPLHLATAGVENLPIEVARLVGQERCDGRHQLRRQVRHEGFDLKDGSSLSSLLSLSGPDNV